MAFQNSILAGTKLVREAIQSPNYVPNVSGWSINKDGTAEFADLTARGRIVSVNPLDPDDRYAYVEDGSIGIVDNNAPAVESTLTETQLAFQGVANSMFFSHSTATGSHWRIAGKHGVMMSPSDTRGFLRWNEDAINTNPEEWTNASLQNGWTNVAGFAAVGYYMRPDGFVALRGVSAAGTVADDTLLFTLPVGYRPLSEALVAIGIYNGASYQVGFLRIETDGQVRIYGAGGAANIRYDGLSFSTI